MTENVTEKRTGLKTIEKHAQELGISPAVLEGVKASGGWKSGRQVEREEFIKACEGFLNAPADGRLAEEEAKG